MRLYVFRLCALSNMRRAGSHRCARYAVVCIWVCGSVCRWLTCDGRQGCNERATNWSITECKKCGQALNRAKSAAATQPMKFLSGFQYELGHNVTSNALRALPNPQLECPHTVTSWYGSLIRATGRGQCV